MDLGTLRIPVQPDLSRFRRDVVSGANQAGDEAGLAMSTAVTSHVNRAAAKLAVTLGGLFAGQKVVEFLAGAVDKASALNETLSKSTVVFGQNAAAIAAFGDASATSLGLSRQAAIESAASFGNLFKTSFACKLLTFVF